MSVLISQEPMVEVLTNTLTLNNAVVNHPLNFGARGDAPPGEGEIVYDPWFTRGQPAIRGGYISQFVPSAQTDFNAKETTRQLRKYAGYQLQGEDAFARKREFLDKTLQNTAAINKRQYRLAQQKTLAVERKQHEIVTAMKRENPDRLAFPEEYARFNESLKDPNMLASPSWILDPGVRAPVEGYNSSGPGVDNVAIEFQSNQSYVAKRDRGFIPPRPVSLLDQQATARDVVKAILAGLKPNAITGAEKNIPSDPYSSKAQSLNPDYIRNPFEP